MKLLIFAISLSFSLLCHGQPLILKADKIYDSRAENYISNNRTIDPDFFNSKKRFWLQLVSKSVLGLEEFGIKYTYDFETKKLKRIDGIFGASRMMSLKHDFTGSIGFNFYFDETVIGWLTKSLSASSLILRYVDIERNVNNEVIFNIPQSFQGIEPVIVDTVQLLFNNYLLDNRGEIDTLKIDRSTTFPSPGDKVFMRKRAFMVDKYYEQENPKADVTGTNPIDYNRIDGHRLITQKILSDNVKIVNYRVETNHGDLWLLSHKSNPEDFCLYNVQNGKIYPFKLDKTIFNLNNLSLAEIVPSGETTPGQNVVFSYLTSMTNESIYIYLIKDGIALYRVSDYRKLLR
jgi:hypothetical protein